MGCEIGAGQATAPRSNRHRRNRRLQNLVSAERSCRSGCCQRPGCCGNAKIRQKAYRELFRYELVPGLVDQIRTATNGGFVHGTERFQKEIAATLGRRTWRGSPGRPVKSDGEVGQQEFEL